MVDMSTQKEVKRFLGHTDSIEYLTFDSEDTQVISVSDDNYIRIWDVKTGAEVRKRRVYKRKERTEEQYIDTAILSPDGKYLCVPLETCLRVFNISTGKIIQDLQFRDKYITGNAFFALDFSHDNTLVAMSYGAMIYIWKRIEVFKSE